MNKKLLRSKMALNGDNNQSLARKLKITKGSISNKINGFNSFKISEMNFIRQDYKLSDREFIEIFIE